MSGLILSYSGKAVSPLNLQPEQVSFEDIPHTLAQKVRFNGHLQQMGYSVAQHCVLGAEALSHDVPNMMAFLLHEVSEVYLPDVPTPIKGSLFIVPPPPDSPKWLRWSTLEDQHAEVMFGALGLSHLLPLIHGSVVKTMDKRMLTTEKRDLRLHGEFDPHIVEQEKWQIEYPPFDTFKIDQCWAPFFAKERFTALYWKLRTELELGR